MGPTSVSRLILGAIEIGIVVALALALAGVIHAGPGGATAVPYNPVRAPSSNGLFLGIVFAIFQFTGFESVAPLAEETQDPRRTLPRAIVLSLAIMGAFYLFCSYGAIVGWGTNNIGGFIGSGENPLFVLAKRLWGGAWILVFLAVINSVIAVSIACTNASTRVFYGMARSGVLPGVLARVHPVYKTPRNAILLQTALTLAIGLGLGLWLGPDQEFFMMGTAVTLGLVFVYGAGNVGVFRLYRGEHAREFNPLLHLVFPLVSTLALLFVGYKSIAPLPAYPVAIAPFLVAAWLLVGVFLAWYLGRTGREEWLRKAGQTAYERAADETEASV